MTEYVVSGVDLRAVELYARLREMTAQRDLLLAACEELAYYIGSLWEADECHCNEGEQTPCWHCRAMKAVTEAEAAIAAVKSDE